jgi:hypothetical protein
MLVMFADFFTYLENLPLAMHIGETWWFPMIESIHVIAITLVFGSLLMVDLRLLGIAARDYTVTSISSELLRWTWVAFVLSVITGALLFITRASHYAENVAFRIKLLLLVIAGINMLAFHFTTFRTVSQWDGGSAIPKAAKLSAATSLICWLGVLLAGRWIGHLN